MARRQATTIAGFTPLAAAALRASVLGTTMLAMPALLTPTWAQPAPNARPTGGQVSAGQATISQSPSTTTINQTSARAAVNWHSFDVGSQQTVQFVQPSSTAATLNRVLSAEPSQIAGHITANGQVVIVNQSGVVFAKGAQVDAASLVVSAPGITDHNFMAGKMVFDQPAQPNAQIVNNGHITVQQSGLAALVAPGVANNGVITAKMGHVVLAGAATDTLDLYGDGMLAINVTGAVAQVPVGSDGKPVTALVTNSGVVAASGGTVQLTARAVDGIVQTLVTAGGHIAADTVGGQTGTVAISGIGGSVIVTGDVSAAGIAAGTKGGAVAVNASNGVTIAAGAHVSASGAAGGGTIAIGTTLARARGGPSVTARRTAASATVAAGAVVTADATQRGDGGTVVVLSTQATSVGGRITARGGPQGGNGGHVELSGQSGFALNGGSVDVMARSATGLVGTILIDPRDLYISTTNPDANNQAASDTTLTQQTLASSPSSLPGSSTDAWVTPASIDNLSGAVTLTASRDLDVLSVLDTTGSDITSLALTAGRNLLVAAGAPITTAGALTLYAGNALATNAAITARGAVALTNLFSTAIAPTGYTNGMTLNAAVTAGTGATLSIATAGGLSYTQLSAPQGTVEIGPSTAAAATSFAFGATANGTDIAAATVRVGTTSLPGALVAGGLTLGDAVHAGINNYGTATLDLHATGAVTQYSGSSLAAGSITGSVGSLALTNSGNSFGTIGTLTATGAVSLSTTSALNLAGTLTASTLSLNTTGVVSQSDASVLNVASLTGTAGTLELSNGTNNIGSIGPFTATDLLELYNAGPLTVGGTLSANYVFLTSTGAMTLASDIVLTPFTTEHVDSNGEYYAGSVFLIMVPDVNGNASFTQTGTSNIGLQGGGSSELHLYNYSPSNLTFNDLEAPGSHFELLADGGAITGQINVGGMNLENYNYDMGSYANTDFYRVGSPLYTGAGSSAFTNTTIGGLTGEQAALATTLSVPGASSTYLVDGCVAGGGSCMAVVQTPPPILTTPMLVSTTNSTPPVVATVPVVATTPIVSVSAGPLPSPPASTAAPQELTGTIASNIATATPVVTGVSGIVGEISTGAITTDDAASTGAATGPVGEEEPGQSRTQQKGVPVVNPLGEMSRAPLRNRAPDPDLVVPNVSERDY